jgi:hypothetical protein
MKKSLYLLHIPKCGGLALQSLRSPLNDNGLANFSFGHPAGFTGYSSYAYIQAHLGTAPIGTEGVDTAILVRDPLERSISNFLWFANRGVFSEDPVFSTLTSVVDKLRYYLFHSKKYEAHQNLQARFLCNGVPDSIFNLVYLPGLSENQQAERDAAAAELGIDVSYPRQMVDWYISNDNTSLDTAKATLDAVAILGVTDAHADFTAKVFDWFIENYGVDVQPGYESSALAYTTSEDVAYVNFSKYVDPETGDVHTTQSMKAELSIEEIVKVYELNSLDLEIYKYAKAKLQ